MPEYEFSNGDRYAGEWMGNQKDGFGVQIWAGGARYEGEWREN